MHIADGFFSVFSWFMIPSYTFFSHCVTGTFSPNWMVRSNLELTSSCWTGRWRHMARTGQGVCHVAMAWQGPDPYPGPMAQIHAPDPYISRGNDPYPVIESDKLYLSHLKPGISQWLCNFQEIRIKPLLNQNSQRFQASGSPRHTHKAKASTMAYCWTCSHAGWHSVNQSSTPTNGNDPWFKYGYIRTELEAHQSFYIHILLSSFKLYPLKSIHCHTSYISLIKLRGKSMSSTTTSSTMSPQRSWHRYRTLRLNRLAAPPNSQSQPDKFERYSYCRYHFPNVQKTVWVVLIHIYLDGTYMGMSTIYIWDTTKYSLEQKNIYTSDSLGYFEISKVHHGTSPQKSGLCNW